MDKDTRAGHHDPPPPGPAPAAARTATESIRDTQLYAIKIVLSEANVRAEVLEATVAKIAAILWGTPKP